MTPTVDRELSVPLSVHPSVSLSVCWEFQSNSACALACTHVYSCYWMSQSLWQSWEPHICVCYIQHSPPPHSPSPFLQRCDESLKWYRCCEWMLPVPQIQTKEVPQLREWITKVNHTLNSGSSLFFLCLENASSSSFGWQWARTCKYCGILKSPLCPFMLGLLWQGCKTKRKLLNRKLKIFDTPKKPCDRWLKTTVQTSSRYGMHQQG